MRSSRTAAKIAAISAALALAAACGGEGDTGTGPEPDATTAAPKEASAEQQGPASLTVHPMDATPPDGTVPAGGLVLTQEVNSGAGGKSCVVLALNNGELGEVGRFDYPVNTAGEDPSHGFERCDHRVSFTDDFSSMVGVRSYRTSPGVDQHPALLGLDGAVTDISGRGDAGVRGESQTNPVIEPGTGRVWMWRPNPDRGVGNPLRLVHSMKLDGGDARDEDEAQPARGEDRATALMHVSQQFTFLGGLPVYYETARNAIATEDGRTAVFKDRGKYHVGPVASLRSNPDLPVTGVATDITPQVFLPDDGDAPRFVATAGEQIVLATVEDEEIVTTVLYEPQDRELRLGTGARTSFVAADDGTVYYTLRNGVPVGDDRERATRIVRLKDGSAEVVAAVGYGTGTATP